MGKVLECGRCGAPLKAEAAKNGFITCEYCGAVTKISPDTPANPQTPVIDSNQIEIIQSVGTAAASSRSAVMLIGIGVSLLVPLLIGVFMFKFSTKNIRISGRSSNKPSKGMTWGQGMCLVHANKDKILDIAVLLKHHKKPRATWSVTFRDGRNGAKIADLSLSGNIEKAKMICLGPAHVGILDADLGLRVIRTRSHSQGGSIDLPDKIRKIGANDTCAKIKTVDGSVTAFSLPEGKTGACPVAKLRRENETQGMPTFVNRRRFIDKDVEYLVTARKKGSPVLTASAVRRPAGIKHSRRRRRSSRPRGQVLWRKRLNITATRYGIPALLTSETVLVVGARHPRRKKALIIGLDKETGKRLFSLHIDNDSVPTFGCAIADNGKWALLWKDDWAQAIDPKTGKIVWTFK